MMIPQVIVMGVSGSGKSTVGKQLADALGVKYLEADDFHPSANITKMSNGEPLDDNDRWPWLDNLSTAASKLIDDGFVMSCSALKESYRTRIKRHLGDNVAVVWLKGDFETIMERVSRKDTRPLLQVPDPRARMRELMDERYPIYAQAHITVPIAKGPHLRTVNKVLRYVDRYLKAEQKDRKLTAGPLDG